MSALLANDSLAGYNYGGISSLHFVVSGHPSRLLSTIRNHLPYAIIYLLSSYSLAPSKEQ